MKKITIDRIIVMDIDGKSLKANEMPQNEMCAKIIICV